MRARLKGDKRKMNEEELFCKLFPEYAVNGKPLSPYFDLFERGYEEAENRIEELEKACEETQELLDKQIDATYKLDKENAELKKNCEDLKEFYEMEYFEIADRTADEKIKELEKYQEEVTVDDYSPYDENTWGMMHEEMYVPKELVRDLLKESYALSEHRKDQLIKAKDLLAKWVELYKPKSKTALPTPIQVDTEQFLSEVEK